MVRISSAVAGCLLWKWLKISMKKGKAERKGNGTKKNGAIRLQQRKWKLEERERKQRLELGAEERRAFINIAKSTNNI